MHMNEAINLYLARYDSIHTIKTNRHNLTQFSEFLKQQSISEVTAINPLHIELYFATKKHLAQATRHKIYRILKSFFNWTIEIEVLDKSPLKMKIKEPKPAIDQNKAMPDEILERILDYTKYNPRNFAIISLLAESGMRAGGVADLRLDNLDLSKNECQTIEKGERLNIYYFGERTNHALQNWLKIRPTTVHNHVFSHSAGTKPLTPSAISAMIRKACKATGSPEYGAHSLRHRLGFKLAQTTDVNTAALVLNHANSLTTQLHYFPRNRQLAREAVKKIAESGI